MKCSFKAEMVFKKNFSLILCKSKCSKSLEKAEDGKIPPTNEAKYVSYVK